MGDSIRVIILAEGGNPRLRPLTEHLPTSLVPVGGTPILDRQIQALFRSGLTRVHVVGGYRSAQVRQACRFYGSVRFAENVRFDRDESRVSSLGVIDPSPGCLLLLRGDLLFDEDLLGRLLEGAPGNVQVTGPDDRGIGMLLCSPGTAQKLFSVGSETLKDDPRLFPYAASLMEGEGIRTVPADSDGWLRVRSLEDLAVALRRHPAPGVPVAA